MNGELEIALVGNPNCGKTSLFNALTGARQHVGNWPGVTVEKKEGKLKFKNKDITVVDLPGTYSLGAYSEDEVVARNFILKDKPDVVINVIDSTNIERNLYLTMQLLETHSNVVLALNMMDEAKNKKIQINIEALAKRLNIPVIPTIATKKEGVNELIEEALKLVETNKKTGFNINYGDDIENEKQILSKAIEECASTLEYPADWTALKLLENDEYIINHVESNCNEKLKEQIGKSVDNLIVAIGYEPDSFIIDKRYELISEVVGSSVKKHETVEESTSDKIDKVVTNKWLGIPIFALIMFSMYQIAITFGNDFLGGFVDDGFAAFGEWVGTLLEGAGVAEILKSFVVDGLIGGLGAVVVFIPMLFVMYFLISLLEDSGYMARAAYVMDRFMTSIGLHGKTAVSLIISSGCNVAGIMSTRTLESKKDRMIAILINPFVSCSARLPVYMLFAGAFFAGKKVGIFDLGGIVVFSLYVLGIVVAILIGKLLSSNVFKGEESFFVMELPPYRVPTAKSLFIHMWEKSEAFIKKAGTVILSIVVVVWALSNLPAGVEPGSEQSFIGIIGSVIAPIFKPAGFGHWQAGVALITGLGAKEAVVTTLGTVYGVADEGTKLTEAIQQNFTALSAYSFMIMTLLYAPCAATIAAIKRETNSTKWALIAVAYTCFIGWFAAVIVYQAGRLMGYN